MMNRRDLISTAGLSAAALVLARSGSSVATSDQGSSTKSDEPPKGGAATEMRVPDTLDLADRGALALHALTGALDRDYGYELYLVAQFCRNPAMMTHEAISCSTVLPLGSMFLVTFPMRGRWS